MNIDNENIIRLCSFYVSKWHLITMLLPYINNKINEKMKIATISETDLNQNVKILINKLNIKNGEKILKINWNNKNSNKYSNIRKIIDINIGNEILIIVNGSNEYIKNVNKNINKYLKNNISKLEVTNTKIKIIDCYEITEFNNDIVEILDKHDKIFNTSGEKEITDIFEDYSRNKKIS